MSNFAKMYETERGQIVAMNDQNSEGYPAIVFFFDPCADGLGVCQIALGFSNDEDGEKKRNKAFDALTEESVCKVVFKQMDLMQSSFGGAA